MKQLLQAMFVLMVLVGTGCEGRGPINEVSIKALQRSAIANGVERIRVELLIDTIRPIPGFNRLLLLVESPALGEEGPLSIVDFSPPPAGLEDERVIVGVEDVNDETSFDFRAFVTVTSRQAGTFPVTLSPVSLQGLPDRITMGLEMTTRVTFKPRTLHGSVEASRSEDILADGLDASEITVTLRDQTGVPFASPQDIVVSVEQRGTNVDDVSFLDASDENGLFRFMVTATSPGRKVLMIRAGDVNGELVSIGSQTLVFTRNLEGNIITGSDEPDVLIGTAGIDSILGLAGSDFLDGGPGADILDGGAGFDTASYQRSPQGVTVNLTLEMGSGGDAEGDVLIDIEALFGSDFDDILEGDDRANVFEGGPGADIIIGNRSFDTSSYVDSPEGVEVDLSSGTAFGGDAQGDVLESIERLVGSSFVDVLEGNDSDNQLVGGPGADILIGNEGSDSADYFRSPEAVQIDLSLGTAFGGDAQGDVLESIERLGASEFDDTLIGSDEDNVFSGGSGDDFLDGGAGRDTLFGGVGSDRIIFDAMDIQLNFGSNLGSSVDDDVLEVSQSVDFADPGPAISFVDRLVIVPSSPNFNDPNQPTITITPADVTRISKLGTLQIDPLLIDESPVHVRGTGWIELAPDQGEFFGDSYRIYQGSNGAILRVNFFIFDQQLTSQME